jgi:hypothetical protein
MRYRKHPFLDDCLLDITSGAEPEEEKPQD